MQHDDSAHAIPPRLSPRRFPAGDRERTRVWAGVWHAVDPTIVLTSVASMLVGASAAAWQGPLQWGWLLITAASVLCFEVAKNASGEVLGLDTGTYHRIREYARPPFSGGRRRPLDELMSKRQTAVVAAVFLAAGAVTGLAIVVLREPHVVWFAILGAVCAYLYLAPRLQLRYRGLGELAVAVSYGPLIACGTYLIQRQTLDGGIILASIPLGLAIMAFLWINEFPDARADEAAGKRTLVVRLGRPQAAQTFGYILSLAFVVLAMLPLLDQPVSLWLGFAGVPHAIAAAHRVRRFPDVPAEIIPAQGWTLLSFFLLAAGTTAGFFLAALL